MSTDITLYGDRFWISPYVYSCFVALREKELAFDVSEIALDKKEQHHPEYRDRTITAKVPALRHGDFWLAESSAIIEYLEEAFPAPKHRALLPTGVRERARARQIISWLRSDLLVLREERPTTTMFYQRASRPLSEAGQTAADKLLRAADLLIAEGATALFGGFSIADADLAFMLQRLALNGHPVPDKVRAFVNAQWARPSVRAFVERVRPAYEHY